MAWKFCIFPKEIFPRPTTPWNLVAYGPLALTATFAVIYSAHLIQTMQVGETTVAVFTFSVVRAAIEMIASYYAFWFIFAAILYIAPSRRRVRPDRPKTYPPLGLVYLCCGDVDRSALTSLCSLEYPGNLTLVVHDDSTSSRDQLQVDQVFADIENVFSGEAVLLRRPQKGGGKPGAVNYVLAKTGRLYEYFLLCDNDSTILDSQTAIRALDHFDRPEVAIVQCRSVAVDDPSYCPVNRILSKAIDVFDVFMRAETLSGWVPFIGHNAFLRTSAVTNIGGLTPGYFADDVDLTTRLTLRGHTVAYADDICIGEKHPPSFNAFRKRNYKWAYGCAQILRRHALSVLVSRRLSFLQKLAFFQFVGFYVNQAMLLFYLTLTCLVGPLVAEFGPIDQVAMLVGTLIVVPIYLPLLVYFAKTENPGSIASIVLCGLTYGTTDFATTRGIVDCVRRIRKPWIPTNGATGRVSPFVLVGESVFGLLLLLVPAAYMPSLLYLPCIYLFAGKFLFTASLALSYDDRMEVGTRGTVFRETDENYAGIAD